MIVFDLKCSHGGHVFEGWFGSGEDFERQKASGILLCPICGDSAVEKAAMAPAVPAKGNQNRPQTSAVVTEQSSGSVPMTTAIDGEKMIHLMQVLAREQVKALASSEWVGRSFADQARAMHYGEQDHKPIHGEVAPEEARSLIEEGVEVAPLLFPVVPPEVQN
jgi:hypothetical protein